MWSKKPFKSDSMEFGQVGTFREKTSQSTKGYLGSRRSGVCIRVLRMRNV